MQYDVRVHLQVIIIEFLTKWHKYNFITSKVQVILEIKVKDNNQVFICRHADKVCMKALQFIFERKDRHMVI